MTITNNPDELTLEEQVFIDGIGRYWHLTFTNMIVLYSWSDEDVGTWQCEDVGAALYYLENKCIEGGK